MIMVRNGSGTAADPFVSEVVTIAVGPTGPIT